MPLTEKDRLLINQLLSGTEGAWSTFVDRYGSLVVQVIRHSTHSHSIKLNQDDIEDLTSDVFATLLDRNMGAIRGFRGRSSFATYLTVIVRRVVLRKLTQRRYLEAFGHVNAHGTPASRTSTKSGTRNPSSQQDAPQQAGPNNPSQQVDARDEVETLMNRLPDSLRSVVELFYLRGFGYEEISQRLGVPINSIGPILTRAKNLMRGSRKAF